VVEVVPRTSGEHAPAADAAPWPVSPPRTTDDGSPARSSRCDAVAAARSVSKRYGEGDDAVHALLAPSVTKRLIGEFARRPAEGRTPPPALDDLTDREREVLGLVAQGLSNSEIAPKLFLSEGMVKTRLKRIFYKMGLRDRAQAVVLAYDVGLVEPKGL
jgi:DNA-binding NarL/FixJ family response regulator